MRTLYTVWMNFPGKVFVFVGFARKFLMVLQVSSVHLRATLNQICYKYTWYRDII